MILAVDIGNSSVIIGYADDNSQQIIGRLAAARHKTEDEYAVDLLRLMELSGLQPADIKGGDCRFGRSAYERNHPDRHP